MKLILTQPEIEQILRKHVNETVTLATGSDYTIEFVATRSNDGIVATIDIPYMGVASLPSIAAAVAASEPAPPATPTVAKAAATTPKSTAKRSAGSILGSGLAGAATEPAINPEPVTPEAPVDPIAETAQDAADAAPFDAAVDAQDVAGQAALPAEEAPPATRGPSLFGNSAFKL